MHYRSTLKFDALPAAKERISALVGPRGYLDRPEDLALYEYDGGQDRHPPDVVVFPRTAAEVGALVRIANQFGMPIVGRGAGTASPAAPFRARAE